MREKVFNAIKVLVSRLIPDKINALEAHEKHDDERFDGMKSDLKELKADVKDSEVRVIDAVKENVGFIMQNISDYKHSTDNRIVMLEKRMLA